MWDHDVVLNDDLIGETLIDLENRFYSKTWRSLSNYPIETRQLYHPDSKTPRGTISLWCEIIKDKASYDIKWSISPKPPAVRFYKKVEKRFFFANKF